MRIRVVLLGVILAATVSSCADGGNVADDPPQQTQPPVVTTAVSREEARYLSTEPYARANFEAVVNTVEGKLGERRRSLFSSGETPATIVNCMLGYFRKALESVPADVDVTQNFLNHFPMTAIFSWIESCSGVKVLG